MLQKRLTKQQQRIFDLIRLRIVEEGMCPTIREIAEEMGFSSPNGVICHLTALEKKGLIVRSSHKSRSIKLTNAAEEELRGLPLAGRVAAGATMQTQDKRERIDFGEMWNRKGTYVLKVTCDSMIDAQIAPGDFVVVQPKRTALRGDIAVIKNADGHTTLKYWFPEKNRVRLQPANKSLKPMYSKDAKVMGVVVGVVRQVR